VDSVTMGDVEGRRDGREGRMGDVDSVRV
jgi:hypothetical protein